MGVSRRSGRRIAEPPRPQSRAVARRPKAATKPRRRSGARSLLWSLYWLLVVVSTLIVAAYVGGRLLIRAPELPTPEPVEPGGTAPVIQGGDSTDPTQPELLRKRREGVYNFVLLGKDVDSGNTDSIILVSYDLPNQKIGMVSIPRDTAVERSWRKNPKINGAFHGAGADVLKEEIQHTFGVPVDFYIHVDLKGFIALVDQLGGVDIEIPVDMNYDDPTPGQELHIHFKKGMQHLDGQKAMEAARYRHDNANPDGSPAPNGTYTDVGRAAFQRQLLVALAKKVVSWNSLTRVKEFLNIFDTYVDTDLSMSDMVYFATQALQLDLSSGITQGNLKGNGSGVYRGFKYCFVFEKEDILPVLNEQVNPYDQPLTQEDLHLPKPEGYC